MKISKENGITLIALIITIIALLILAGVAISMVVGDNGVLGQAINAITATDIADTKEQIELEIIEKLDENGDYTIATVFEVAKEITGNDVDTENKTVVSAKGNTVDISNILDGAKTSWYYDNNGNITNGIVTVAIGDYVNYDPENYTYISLSSISGYSTDQVFNTSSYAYSWRVLGVDENTGELLIISEAGVEPDSGGITDTYSGITTYILYNQLGYINAESELNAICNIYGNGYGATGSRSLTLADVNNLTGYDPTDIDGAGTPYGNGYVHQYGNKVTYSMLDGIIAYSSSNDISGNLSNTYFLYYNELSGEWKTTLNENESITFTQSCYWYSGEDYLDSSSLIYELLFLNASGNYTGSTQFLANKVVTVRTDNRILRCKNKRAEKLITGTMENSRSNHSAYTYSISGTPRPVVSLASDISLKWNDSDGWEIIEE